MGNVMAAFPGLIRRLGVDPSGQLVHVGAHEGQEMPYYYEAGFTNITLVEPIPDLARQLRTRFPMTEVVEAACTDRDNELAQLHVMAKTNMSTLVAPQSRDQVVDSYLVQTRRLDAIAPNAKVAVIDAQGLELEVLEGAPWDSLELLIVESCTEDDSTMASPYDLVTEVVTTHGFVEVDRWVRDYDFVNKWARGNRQQKVTGGEVRDVVFQRGDLL
jgi:FkbM family methyltransferase